MMIQHQAVVAAIKQVHNSWRYCGSSTVVHQITGTALVTMYNQVHNMYFT